MARGRRPVVWSPEARFDLAEIWDYYAATGGKTVANKIIRRIAATCRLLHLYPFAGRVRDEIRPGLRSLATNPHVVFYRVKNDTAEIVRVLDGRRDLGRMFDDDNEVP